MHSHSDIEVNTIREIRNLEHGYGWKIMCNPEALDYGVLMTYHNTIADSFRNPAEDNDGENHFSWNEAEAIANALLEFVAEAKKQGNAEGDI